MRRLEIIEKAIGDGYEVELQTGVDHNAAGRGLADVTQDNLDSASVSGSVGLKTASKLTLTPPTSTPRSKHS